MALSSNEKENENYNIIYDYDVCSLDSISSRRGEGISKLRAPLRMVLGGGQENDYAGNLFTSFCPLLTEENRV